MKPPLTQTVGRWAALIIGIAWIAFLLMFGIGELFGDEGDRLLKLGHAFSHIVVQGLPVALVTWLAWKKPFWGGIAFLLLTVGAAWMFGMPRDWFIWTTIYVPFPLLGVMLISGGLARNPRKA